MPQDLSPEDEADIAVDTAADDVVEQLPDQEEFWRPPARFGSIPVDAEPLGWDRRQGFQKHYPRVDLPTQIVERVRLGKKESHEPNRLIWGDNLHVMRQIPSNSIDLIYIDPPFFSGRQYNVMWGDRNERRSFNDIWEGGMPGYLIWLNARLYEMKRLLKSGGSIYVHCDWHASHYIKVEMDKIFGHENFQNEIIWRYRRWPAKQRRLQKMHDVLLLYSNQEVEMNVFNQLYEDLADSTRKTWGTKRQVADFSTGRRKPSQTDQDSLGAPMSDVWEIGIIAPIAKERIGYPTQKPEALLERIIRTSSNIGDVVADFVMGGGTSLAVAQRLGRRWIGCDQSRVAVAVTAERLKQDAQTRGLEDEPYHDFTIEHWGIYEADRLSQMSASDFREFVLRSYGATRVNSAASAIHGWRNQHPIWVGEPDLDSRASHEDVETFANAIRRTKQYQQSNLRDGTMLAWGFDANAYTAADRLRQQEEVDVDFVRLQQIRIGDDQFREHIVSRSTDRGDYSEFLTFVQPPVVSVAYRANGGRAVTFDAGDSVVVNSDSEIINVQWDFNYDGRRFVATEGYSFNRDKKSKRPTLQVTHKFDRSGEFRVACRLQDSRGGEGVWIGKVSVA